MCAYFNRYSQCHIRIVPLEYITAIYNFVEGDFTSSEVDFTVRYCTHSELRPFRPQRRARQSCVTLCLWGACSCNAAASSISRMAVYENEVKEERIERVLWRYSYSYNGNICFSLYVQLQNADGN
jgi:hypothetical protein